MKTIKSLALKHLFVSLSKTGKSRIFEAGILFSPVPIIVVLSRSFGLGWDEPVQRLTGAVNLKYIANKIGNYQLPSSTDAIPNLSDYSDRFFGPIYEMLLLGLEYVLKVTDYEHMLKGELQTFQFRHLVTAIVCYLLSVFGYLLIRDIYGKRVGILTLLLYWSFPRIFADSFYNSKDAVVAAGVLLLFYLAFRFYKNESVFSLISFFLSAGVLCTIRLPLILVVLVLFLTVILKKSRDFKLLLISFFSLALSVYMAWPFLWISPVSHLAEAFKDMMSRDWNGEVLFLGDHIRADSLPLNYLITWISVTTPLMCLVLFVSGIFLYLSKIRFKAEVKNTNTLNLSRACLGIFFSANLYFIVFRPTIYDGWRHFYFLYPVMVLLSSSAIAAVINANELRKVKITSLSILVLFSYIHILNLFPYGNLYFNSLMSKKNLETRMEMDYWGLSNKRILNSISTFATEIGVSRVSILHNDYNPIESSVRMLDTEVKFDFFEDLGMTQACLYVTNFRLDRGVVPPNYVLIDTLQISSYRVAAVYANGSCSDKWSSFRV